MDITTYLQGKTLGFNNAHPDDIIPQSHLLTLALENNIPVHEIAHTKGRGSSLNFRTGEQPPFSVKNGDREQEGLATAKRAGHASYTQHDGPDGGLAKVEDALVETTAEWVREHGITVLGCLATGDHPDHDTTVRVGRRVAALLYEEGYQLDLLELQAPGTAADQGVVIPASQESIALAFVLAGENPSQFQVAKRQMQPDWVHVPGGLYVSPHTAKGLRQYPIMQDAVYRRIPAGEGAKQ